MFNLITYTLLLLFATGSSLTSSSLTSSSEIQAGHSSSTATIISTEGIHNYNEYTTHDPDDVNVVHHAAVDTLNLTILASNWVCIYI